jgi:hypothetical protein
MQFRSGWQRHTQIIPRLEPADWAVQQDNSPRRKRNSQEPVGTIQLLKEPQNPQNKSA